MTRLHAPVVEYGAAITRSIGPKPPKASGTARRIRWTMFEQAANAGHADMVTRHARCALTGAWLPFDLLSSGHVQSAHEGGLYWPSNLLPMGMGANNWLGPRHLYDVAVPHYDSRMPVNELAPDPGPGAMSLDYSLLIVRA